MLCARRRDLHPRHQIRTHTVHTFGSSGHDVTRFVPRDLLESPGPAAYPTLEYDTLVPSTNSFHDGSLSSEEGTEADGERYVRVHKRVWFRNVEMGVVCGLPASFCDSLTAV